jgi:hypothetical protein
MFAAPGDKFRLSCVTVAGIFAAFFIAPLAYNFPSTACLVGLVASWLTCSVWTLRSYSQKARQKAWRQCLRFLWLSICMVLSVELSILVARLFTDSSVSMLRGLWLMYSAQLWPLIESCT